MLCTLDSVHYGFSVLYLLLAVWSASQVHTHWPSFRSAQSTSLKIYLCCTVLFCMGRSIDFLTLPTISKCSYDGWQWDILSHTHNPYLIVCATLPAALFFTSYTSFAYSLARVYDSIVQGDTRSLLRYLLLLSNVLVYVTLGIYYFCASYASTHTNSRFTYDSFDRTAQLCVAFAALVTAGAFIIYIAALTYLYVQAQGLYNHPMNVDQLGRFLKVRNITAVSCVCTICFALRAVLLLADVHLHVYTVLVYFTLVELLPTTYMLYTFRNRPSNPFPISKRMRAEMEVFTDQLAKDTDKTYVRNAVRPYVVEEEEMSEVDSLTTIYSTLADAIDPSSGFGCVYRGDAEQSKPPVTSYKKMTYGALPHTRTYAQRHIAQGRAPRYSAVAMDDLGYSDDSDFALGTISNGRTDNPHPNITHTELVVETHRIDV